MNAARTQDAAEVGRQVRRVLIITLILNAVVALAKIGIGLMTGALAITADGFHSLIDAMGNVVALVASRISVRPADEDHPFGHRRVETIAALGIGVLLLLTAFEVVSSAIDRLTTGASVEVTALSFAVLIVTLIINVFVAAYERREGRRLRSQILLADSANTSADVYVTLSVLVSLVLTAAGYPWADTLVALVIVGLIARAGLKILRSTGTVLIDTAPLPAGVLMALAGEVLAEGDVLRARSRGSVDDAYVYLDVAVAPHTPADRSAAMADAMRARLMDGFPGITEVEVHFEPLRDAPPDYALLVRTHADALGLSTHAVHVTDGPRGRLLELHVEVAGVHTLAEAHDRVTRLEASLRSDLPDVAEIVTHIEPAETVQATTAPAADGRLVAAQALAALEAAYPQGGWHALEAVPSGDGDSYALVAHAGLPADMPLSDAHLLAERAERTLRRQMPQLERVTIHTEPAGER